MGARGPKPINLEALRSEATQWATFLFTLRDGQAGLIEKVEWGLAETIGLGKEKIRTRKGRIIAAKIVPLDAEAARELPPELRTKDWVFFRPVFPKAQAWEQLKQARSVKELRQAAQSIRKWERQFGALVIWRRLPPTIHSHAKEILRAKRLANYPKTNRPQSDDKRIVFLAKVLAGLTMGIAPVTATKRLSRWRWPKEWAEKGRTEFIRQFEAQKEGGKP